MIPRHDILEILKSYYHLKIPLTNKTIEKRL